MCHFKSAIVVRDESAKGGFRLLMSPWTESHSDLIAIHNLRDDGVLRFARVEFTPPSLKTAHLAETYLLRIDENRTPDWFDDDMKERVTEKMRDYIKHITVTGDVTLLIGGQFVIAPSAKVECAKTCVINVMVGGHVGTMRDSAKVGEMRESAKVGEMRESAKVGEMWDSAKVGTMRDSAKVGTMRDSANVGEMWDSAKVGEMRESANVGEMRDSAKVGEMRDSAKVGTMRDSAKVGEMRDSANVGEMWESANVGNDYRKNK